MCLPIPRWVNDTQHDTAPAHTALSVLLFLTQNGMTSTPHPPWSRDLGLSDFLLFPQKTKVLKGK